MPIKNPGPSDASKTGAASRESSPERRTSPFSSVSLDNSPQSPESGPASPPPPPPQRRSLASFFRGIFSSFFRGGLNRPSSQRESGAQGSGGASGPSGASGPGGSGSSGQVGPGDGGLLPGAEGHMLLQYSEEPNVDLDAPPTPANNLSLIYGFFLEGRSVLRQAGQRGAPDKMVTFDGIMRYSAAELEGEHSFIQYLFPTTAVGRYNRRAPALDKETVQALNMNSDVQIQQQKAFRMMLNFFKLKEENQGKPEYRIVPSCDYKIDKPNWLNQEDHNQLRLSRMVKSLYLLGNEKEAIAFHHAINLLGNEHGVPVKTMRYWDKCAVQAIVKKQQFLPGVPKEGLRLLHLPSLMPRKDHADARERGETRAALTTSLLDAKGMPITPSVAPPAPRPSAPPAPRHPDFRALQPDARPPSRGMHRVSPPPVPPRHRGLTPQQPPVSGASGTRVLTQSEKKTMEELEAKFKTILERGKK